MDRGVNGWKSPTQECRGWCGTVGSAGEEGRECVWGY